MPLRHFVHVIGFEVPVHGKARPDEPLVVLLDKVPVERWRAVFQECAEELVPGLRRGAPTLQDDTIRFLVAGPMSHRQAADIRGFVDRVNRLTFLQNRGSFQPL